MTNFLASFIHAGRGMKHAILKERNFRIKSIIAVLVVAAMFYFDVSSIRKLILLLTIGVVLVLELINTTIENLVDLIEPEFHQKAKIIKDVTAGAVLLVSIIAAIIGVIVFYPLI